jgi:oligopeptide/dipeptide ABC transporter ATP-binding protein
VSNPGRNGTPAGEPLLVAEGLAIDFPGPGGARLPAVRDLSMTIPRGGSVGLVGESGSGKTMTALALLGLTPPSAHVEARRLTFEDQDLAALSPRELQRLRGARIGYIPQDPLAALNPVLVVGDQITEVERMHPEGHRPRALREVLRGYGIGARSDATVRRAAELLDAVKIPHPRARAVQYPYQYSGGMRQRAILASSLSRSPSLIVADEPTTALDATVEKEVLDLLATLRAEQHLALLLVSHDLNVVSWHCDYVYVLYDGRVLEQGPTESIFRRPRQPYTAALLAATPDIERPPRPRERGSASERTNRRSDGCPFAPRCPQALPVCSERFPETRSAGPDHRFACHNPL